jgi:ABC-2 type transport system permease protein
MGPWLAVYLQFARCAFQRRAAYRLANWTGFLVNFVFFVIHAEVIRAFFGARETWLGWTRDQAVLYYAVSQSLVMVIGAFPDRTQPLMERIRSGDVAVELARPVAILPRELAVRFGDGLYFLGTRAVALFAASAFVYGVAPEPRLAWAWLPVSLALALVVTGCCYTLAQATAFWSEHALGPVASVTFALAFFGGLSVPIAFYPGWAQAACWALPFPAGYYTPVAIAVGRLEGQTLALALLHQLGWAIALIGLGRAVERRGVRRLVALGG